MAELQRCDGSDLLVHVHALTAAGATLLYGVLAMAGGPFGHAFIRAAEAVSCDVLVNHRFEKPKHRHPDKDTIVCFLHHFIVAQNVSYIV